MASRIDPSIRKGFQLFILSLYQHKSLSLQEVKKNALAKWNSLSKIDREDYNRQAEEIPHINERIEEIERIEQFERMKLLETQQKEEAEIMAWIDESVQSTDWFEKQWLFLSSINFVETKDSVFPAELAMSKFSLREGIIDTMHMRINPGRLPIGTMLEAQNVSEESHKMPLPDLPGCEGESDWNVIHEKICNFAGIKEYFGEKSCVVFSDAAGRNVIKRVWTEVESCITKPGTADFVQLFYFLNKRASEENKKKKAFSSIEEVRQIVLKNPFEISNIGCDYHREQDTLSYCALSRARRWAYQIFQNILKPHQLIIGKHTPYPC